MLVPYIWAGWPAWIKEYLLKGKYMLLANKNSTRVLDLVCSWCRRKLPDLQLRSPSLWQVSHRLIGTSICKEFVVKFVLLQTSSLKRNSKLTETFRRPYDMNISISIAK